MPQFVDARPAAKPAGSNGLPRCLRCGAPLTTENSTDPCPLPPVLYRQDGSLVEVDGHRPKFVNLLVWSTLGAACLVAASVAVFA